MKVINIFLFCILASFISLAQNPTPGSLNISASTDGEYVVIKVEPVAVAVPSMSNLTAMSFTITWPSAYGVDLDIATIITSIGVASAGSKGAIGANDVRLFTIAAPVTVGAWIAPTEIMRIKTTLNSPTHLVGDFTIHPYSSTTFNAGAAGAFLDPSPFIEFNASAAEQYIMDPTTPAVNVPLPIELLSFNAVAAKESIDLRWATAKEENFRGFDLERSVDGKKFDKIAFVAGKAAKGATYDFSDRNVSKGTRYFYRLKIVNTDATFEYSDIRTAMIQGAATTGVTIYPNPSNGDVKLDFTLEEDTNTTIDLFDIAGKNVFRKEVEAKKDKNTITLEVMDLPSGVYTVRMNMGGKIVTKLIKLAKN